MEGAVDGTEGTPKDDGANKANIPKTPDHGTAPLSNKQRFHFGIYLTFNYFYFKLFTRHSHFFFVASESTNSTNDQQQKSLGKVWVSNKQRIPFWSLLKFQSLLFYIIYSLLPFFFMIYYLQEMNNGTAPVSNKQCFPFWNLMNFNYFYYTLFTRHSYFFYMT